MKLPPLSELFSRLTALGRRYVWFFVPFLLIFALSPLREAARLWLVGSSLGYADSLPWSQKWLSESPRELAVTTLKKKHSGNFSLAVREVWEGANGGPLVRGWDDEYAEVSYLPSPVKTEAKFERLRRQFPRQKWLASWQLAHALRGWNSWLIGGTINRYGYINPAQKGSAADIKAAQKLLGRLTLLARRECIREPKNAFPRLVLALFLDGQNRKIEALQALEAASKCPFYDDHVQELSRTILDSVALARPLLVEEKLWVFAQLRGLPWENNQIVTFQQWGQSLAFRAYGFLLRKQFDRALKWSAIVARVGALMQTGRNSSETACAGATMQREAWTMVFGTKAFGRFYGGLDINKIQSDAAAFAALAAQHGQKDLAHQTKTQGFYSWRVMRRFPDSYNTNPDAFIGRSGKNLTHLNALQIAILCQIFVLWVVWCIVALLLFRGQGAASTRGDRTAVALFCALLALGLAAATIQFDPLEYIMLTRNWQRSAVIGTLVVCAFVFPFFGSALWCAFVTMRRHKAAWTLPPRVELHMALPLFSRRLLRFFLPFLCAATGFSFVILWGSWAYLAWIDFKAVDVFAFLPPGTTIFGLKKLVIGPNEVAVGAVYTAFLILVCIFLWILKWRYATATHAKAVAHGGLRWWKEAMGAYLIVAAWVFFAFVLASFPLRARAEADFQKVLQNGELSLVEAEK